MKAITQSAQQFQASDKNLNDLADFFQALMTHEGELCGEGVSDEIMDAYGKVMDIMSDWTGYTKTRFNKAIRAMDKLAQKIA